MQVAAGAAGARADRRPVPVPTGGPVPVPTGGPVPDEAARQTAGRQETLVAHHRLGLRPTIAAPLDSPRPLTMPHVPTAPATG
ncbi:hypothetical protein ACFU53_12480 [Streptomyces sp. NPDC057474]|uniref:hypothetical protein n=1 Tax=Streptomyces sp. NPDC057474 TaxID=3346144 RepID=UPI0036A0B3E8